MTKLVISILDHMNIITLLNSLVKQPPEIINLVLAYIPKPFLPIFLDFAPLVPYILPIIIHNVRIQEGYYRSEDPIDFFSSEFYNSPPVFDLMEDLAEMVQKFDVYPKDLEMVNVLGKLAEKFPSKQDERRETTFMVWGHKYKEILHNISSIHILDPVTGSNWNDMSFCLTHRFTLGSITYLSEDLENIMRICPETLQILRLPYYNFAPSDVFLRFYNLKTLEIKNADLRIFNFLPPTTENLIIERLGTLTNFDYESIPILYKLSYLEVGIRHINDFPLVTMKFPNLKLFHIQNSHHLSDFDSLHIPDTINVLKIASCPNLVNYTSLKTFHELRQISVFNVPVSFDLFNSIEYIPNLIEFSFIHSFEYDYSEIYDLDLIKFPKSLRILEFRGNFCIQSWEPPENLQKLSLRGTTFTNGINFKFPINLNNLVMSSTNLSTMDGVQFPPGLRVLEIRENQNLTTMINTNLQQLTRLVDVKILSNQKLSKLDNFNEELREGVVMVYNNG